MSLHARGQRRIHRRYEISGIGALEVSSLGEHDVHGVKELYQRIFESKKYVWHEGTNGNQHDNKTYCS